MNVFRSEQAIEQHRNMPHMYSGSSRPAMIQIWRWRPQKAALSERWAADCFAPSMASRKRQHGNPTACVSGRRCIAMKNQQRPASQVHTSGGLRPTLLTGWSGVATGACRVRGFGIAVNVTGLVHSARQSYSRPTPIGECNFVLGVAGPLLPANGQGPRGCCTTAPDSLVSTCKSTEPKSEVRLEQFHDGALR